MEISEEWNIPFLHSVISNEKGRLLRGAESKSSIRGGYERQIYKKVKYVLCVSEDEQNDFINLYGIDKSKIIVAGQKNKFFISISLSR